MATQNENNSALGPVFAVIGIIAALAKASEDDMGGGEIIILVFITAFVGYAVGAWIEATVIRIIFLVAAIIMFLMNVAIRRFIWELLSSIFGG